VTQLINYREKLRELQEKIQDCQKCPLAAGRKKVVLGEGAVPCSILFLGEGPGEPEDDVGRPAIGRPGRLLRQVITSSGIPERNAPYFITDLVRCRLPNNRDPTPGEAEACWEWTREVLLLTNPQVVVTLGRTSLAYLAKRCGVQKQVGASRITELAGKAIHVPERHFTIFPCLNPSFVRRNEQEWLPIYKSHFEFLAMSLPSWTKETNP
jgi:uracil-DNA glycosylase